MNTKSYQATAKENRGHSLKGDWISAKLYPCGASIVILPVPCWVPVVLGVVEPAAVEVVAEVAGACSVAVGVVGAVIAVGVDGVVLNEQKKTKLQDKKILNYLQQLTSTKNKSQL